MHFSKTHKSPVSNVIHGSLPAVRALTQDGVVKACFHSEVGKYVRKVKLPEVAKEEAEATFMVLFTPPLQRLRLVDTHKQKSPVL